MGEKGEGCLLAPSTEGGPGPWGIAAVALGLCLGLTPCCARPSARLMEQCWADDPRERPCFSAIVQELEDIVEEDAVRALAL